MLFVVVEVFGDLLQDNPTDVLETADARLSFTEVTWADQSAIISLSRALLHLLCVSNMRRIAVDTQAAERRTWNSKPSEETRVTKGEGVAVAMSRAMLSN